MSGDSGSTSESRPLNAKERSELFNTQMSDVGNQVNNPVFSGMAFQSPSFQPIGDYQTLSNGDYDALENAMYTGATSGLRGFEATERERVDQDMSNRGIWSSGIASQGQMDVSDMLADNYQSAGANATAQRYGMQAQDVAGMNQFNLGRSAMINDFNTNQASQQYASQWAPMEYLAGMYNGTGGAISNTSGGGTSGFSNAIGAGTLGLAAYNAFA